jgi:membrane protease YdiL (CAAX protease family)
MNFLDFGFEGDRKVWTYVRSLVFLFSIYILSSLFIVLDWELFFAKQHKDLLINDEQIPDIMGRSRYLFWLLFPFLMATLALLFAVNKFHQRKVITLFTSRPKFDWKRYLVGFSGGVVLLVPLLVIEFFNNSNLVWQFNWSLFLPLLLVSILLLPIQTLAEELIFRSYAMQGIKARTGSNRASIIISSLLSAAMHFSNPEVEILGYGVLPYYFIMGVFFALLTFWDKGIELSSGFHAANNLLTALFVTSTWQAFQTDAMFIDRSTPQFSWTMYLPIAVIIPISIFMFQKIYRWNWRID